MKWIAVAGAVLVAALLLLWREVRSGESPAPVVPAPKVSAPAGERAPGLPPRPEEQTPSANLRRAGTLAPEDDVGAIVKDSDEFYERIDETYSRRLLGFAAECYEGGKERKQKLKIGFRFQIVDGSVAVQNARIIESDLNDPKLEQCMLNKVARATFKDPRMPDWSTRGNDEEELLVRVKSLKRFGPEED